MSLLRRRLMMQAETRYIHFEDPEVERICLENWDKDGDGRLSKEEAGQVTSVSDKFRGNTKLKSFMELQYFTEMTGFSNGAFSGCTSLERIALPEGSSLCHTLLADCKALREVVFPHNMGTSQNVMYGTFDTCTSLEVLDFPETFTRTVCSNSFNNVTADLIFRSKTVVGYQSYAGWPLMYSGHGIYVPDNLVESYKTADGWKGQKDKIKPLSEYRKP